MFSTRHNIINNASFTATVTGPTLSNFVLASSPGVAAWSVVTRVGAITTTPTLTITVNVSVDGVNWVPAGTGAALSTANANQRLLFSNGGSGAAPNFGPIVEPFIQVVAAFGGSGNFANTSVDIVGIGSYD